MTGWCPTCVGMQVMDDVHIVSKQGREVAVGVCWKCGGRAQRIVVGE